MRVWLLQRGFEQLPQRSVTFKRSKSIAKLPMSTLLSFDKYTPSKGERVASQQSKFTTSDMRMPLILCISIATKIWMKNTRFSVVSLKTKSSSTTWPAWAWKMMCKRSDRSTFLMPIVLAISRLLCGVQEAQFAIIAGVRPLTESRSRS